MRYQCCFCSSQDVRIKPCARDTNSPSAAPSRNGGETRGRCATMEKKNKGPDPFLCHPALVGPNHCQQTLLSSTKKTQQGSDSAMTTLVCVAKSVKQHQCPCYSSQDVRIRTCAKGTNSPSAKPRRDGGTTRGRCGTMETAQIDFWLFCLRVVCTLRGPSVFCLLSSLFSPPSSLFCIRSSLSSLLSSLFSLSWWSCDASIPSHPSSN